MQKWEYYFLATRWDDVKKEHIQNDPTLQGEKVTWLARSPDGKMKARETVAQELGDMGWELVAVESEVTGYSNVFIFKRPKS